jgi:hypothetical protein
MFEDGGRLHFESDKVISWTTTPPTPTQSNLYGTSRQPRRLIFGMQTYFDPTRKMSSIKMEDDLKKMGKNENNLKKKEDNLKKLNKMKTTSIKNKMKTI